MLIHFPSASHCFHSSVLFPRALTTLRNGEGPSVSKEGRHPARFGHKDWTPPADQRLKVNYRWPKTTGTNLLNTRRTGNGGSAPLNPQTATVGWTCFLISFVSHERFYGSIFCSPQRCSPPGENVVFIYGSWLTQAGKWKLEGFQQ